MNRFFSLGTACKYFLSSLLIIYSINGHAGTICTGTCPPDIVPPITSNLQVPYSSGLTITQLPALPTIFIQPPTQSATGWQYGFGTANLASMTIPFFSDSLISGITVLNGWSISTGATDVFGLGNGAGYMRFSSSAATTTAYTLLSFLSSFGPASSTYQFAQLDGTIFNMPGFIPLSPMALTAGLRPYITFATPTPEAETWVLMFIGLVFVYFAKRRRRLAGC